MSWFKHRMLLLGLVIMSGLLLLGCDPGGSGSTDPQDQQGGTNENSNNNATCANGPLDAPIPGCTPAPVPDSGDFRADCVARINQFRWDCQCLPPLERWNDGETCADQHAEYDSTRDPHAGFKANICTPGGWAQNECPAWWSEASIVDGCLQMMWDEGPGVDFKQHGHYINMSSIDYTRVACGVYTTPSGNVWSVQNFE
jgi:hypothetical protein